MKKKYSFFERLAQAYGAGPQPRTYVIQLPERIEGFGISTEGFSAYLIKWLRDKFNIPEEITPYDKGVLALRDWAEKYDQILISPTRVVWEEDNAEETFTGGRLSVFHSIETYNLGVYVHGINTHDALVLFET